MSETVKFEDFFYFCPNCKEVHSYDPDNEMNRKICFVCLKKCEEETKHIYNHNNSSSLQVCSECEKKYDWDWNWGVTFE